MDQPVEPRRDWRWVLFIRVLRKNRCLEVADVKVLEREEVFLGEPVDESASSAVGERIDVIQDAVDTEPLEGLSVPDLGLHYEDRTWTLGD